MPIGRPLRCHFVLAGEATQSLPRGVIGEAGAPVVLRTSGKAASITAIVLRSDDADSFFRARNHLGMDKRIAVQFGHLLDGFHDGHQAAAFRVLRQTDLGRVPINRG